MKLLLIEDDSEFIDDLKEVVQEKGLATEKPLATGFAGAIEKIKSFQPDVVILDIFEDPLDEGKAEGAKSLDFIRNKSFRPVIVYSARPERVEGEHEKHDLVHYVKKAAGHEELVEKLKKIRPYVDSLKSVEEYVRNTFSSVMDEVVPYMLRVYGDEDGKRLSAAIRQAARRRLAAQMDELSEEGEKLAPWEQYIFPPISEEIRLGDILKKKNSESREPHVFRLVLTPSCDLEKHGDRRKVENALVSRCCSIKKGLRKAINVQTVSANNKEETREKIRKSFLSLGHSNGIIPLPKLPDIIPSMAADLRNLQLTPVDKIEGLSSSGKTKYERIASLDSPFRELVSWAYMQIAGRPGLPERDFDTWVDEIFEEFDS